jgi:hypothetical protein
MVTQVRYSVARRLGGQVMLYAVRTMHKEMRTVGLLVKPQKHWDGLSVVWPQSHWDGLSVVWLQNHSDAMLVVWPQNL